VSDIADLSLQREAVSPHSTWFAINDLFTHADLPDDDNPAADPESRELVGNIDIQWSFEPDRWITQTRDHGSLICSYEFDDFGK
jgi:hypothetical protein